MVYKFVEGSRFAGNPNVVGKFLTQIKKQTGSLTPPVIVDAARPKKSPLHRYFEWDNSRAAERWRIQQARLLVCSVVTVSVDGEETTPVRSFISLNDNYEMLEVVMSDEQMRQQAIYEVNVVIKNLKEKISSFREFADVLEALEKASQAASKHFKGVKRVRATAR